MALGGNMRNLFVLVSAFVIAAAAAFPQASNWTQTQMTDELLKKAVSSLQAEDTPNYPKTEVLKQLAANGYPQGSAVLVQQQRSPLIQPPPVSSWTKPFPKMGNGLDLRTHDQELIGMLPNPPKACAIPLLEVPVDGSVDRGISIPNGMKSGSSSDPKIAMAPPAPACENHPSSMPKVKTK
jgi:hypothetical protein